MRKIIIYGMLAVSVASLALMGFQCSSAEMTSAKLYIQRKEYDNAEAQLKKEIAKNPKNEEAYYLLGREVYYAQKRYKEMADVFKEALAIAPTHQKDISVMMLQSWASTFNDGVEKLNKAEKPEDYDPAIEAFKLAVYLQPDSMVNEQNLGLAYYRRGDFENAVAPLTVAFEKGNSLFAIKLLSGIYMNKASEYKTKFTEDNREVIETKKNLDQIREKMKAADVKYILGQPESVDQEKKGKGKKTIVVSEKWSYPKYNLVVTVQDETVTGVNYSTPYATAIDSTNYKLAVKEFDKAIDILKKGIVAYPEDADISESLMNAFIGAERNDEARALLIARVKKFPDSKYDRYNYGVFLLKDGEFEKAVNEFKAALDIDPAFDAATYNLAATYVNWGVAETERLKAAGKEDDKSYQEKYKSAIPYLEKVLEGKPGDIQMWELLGQVYANLGNAKKATEAYNKADEIRNGKN
jgi:tetratricopeptide (TPR) repeat protein